MGWLIFLCVDINELCIQGNRRLQWLSNYLSNYQSLLFLLSKSKQGPLVTWAKTGICSERGHKGSNGPIPTMTSWQNAMTSAFHYLPHLNLLYTFFFFLPVLPSLGENKIKVYVQFSLVCKVSYPTDRMWQYRCLYRCRLLVVYKNFGGFGRNRVFPEQSWYIILYHIISYRNRLKVTISPTFNFPLMWNGLNVSS